jgi:hypothetical protein
LTTHESFHGTQYTSSEFTGLLAHHEMIQSLWRPRQCWDNAVAENFFASLKLELIDRRSWTTRTQVRRAVFDYIEVFFNRRRLHSSLNYMTPVEYEAIKIHQQKAAHAAESRCPANRVNPTLLSVAGVLSRPTGVGDQVTGGEAAYGGRHAEVPRAEHSVEHQLLASPAL